jgi:hypothetical protein
MFALLINWKNLESISLTGNSVNLSSLAGFQRRGNIKCTSAHNAQKN